MSDPTYLKKLILIVRTAKSSEANSDPSKMPSLKILPVGKHTIELEFPDITGDEFEQGYSGVYEWTLPKDGVFEHKRLKPAIKWHSTDGWLPDFVVLLSVGKDDHLRVEAGAESWTGGMFDNTKGVAVSKPI